MTCDAVRKRKRNQRQKATQLVAELTDERATYIAGELARRTAVERWRDIARWPQAHDRYILLESEQKHSSSMS